MVSAPLLSSQKRNYAGVQRYWYRHPFVLCLQLQQERGSSRDSDRNKHQLERIIRLWQRFRRALRRATPKPNSSDGQTKLQTQIGKTCMIRCWLPFNFLVLQFHIRPSSINRTRNFWRYSSTSFFFSISASSYHSCIFLLWNLNRPWCEWLPSDWLPGISSTHHQTSSSDRSHRACWKPARVVKIVCYFSD